jgi:hypothetical protein
MPNHFDILAECLATQQKIDALQEKITYARIVAYDNQAIQIELDRAQSALDEQRDGLELHMAAFAASN